MVLPDAAREVVETELRRLGACSPCVLRFLGTPAADAGAYRDACARDAAAASSSGEQATCPCCLGILQFDPDPAKVDASDEDGQAPRVDVDGGGGGGAKPFFSGSSSAREDADDVPPRRSPRLASHYAAGMRSAGHEITTFALEVTLPPSIPMRQAATRALLVEALRGVSAEKKNASFFSSPPATTELRDAFRATLVPALEATATKNATNRETDETDCVRHDPNAPFKFALLFEHERCRFEAGFATRKAEELGTRDGRNRKRRAPPPQLRLATLPDSPAATWQRVGAAYNISEKRAAEAFTTVASFEADEHASRAMAAVRGEESRDDGESQKTKTKTKTARATCRLFPWHQPCYLGGRYLKWKRGVPQSPWFADGGVVGEGSVQTSLETFALKAFKSRGCRLNSAGREDMDVRMLGGGRPFILEVHDPRRPAAFADESERLAMESFLADDNDGAVTATNIHPVPREAYITMHEGSAEKRKTYTAVCWASRALTDADLRTLTKVASGLTVKQKTPTRVLHRRTSATRPRVIHDAKASAVKGSPRFFLLELTTQAGTYIKEFVHGDFGRTSPSVGEILGCEADILQLDVTDIEMAFGGGEDPGEEE